MNQPNKSHVPHVAVACGGTGGHIFPGLSVAHELVDRGCRVTLFVSEKEVDRRAVQEVNNMNAVSLPSVGLVRGRRIAFGINLWKSVRRAKALFRDDCPDAVLAMGGFTSAAPIIAAHKFGKPCFLHESNTVAGRANRWLSRYADEVFVGFEMAERGFKNRSVRVTGTPVRAEFRPENAAIARESIGLRPNDPVLLIMGGSQGASGINRLVIEALPGLVDRFPLLQFIHLTGVNDLEDVQSVYHRLGVKALVQLFCAKMHDALAAATLTISRAGASSLAEIAAVRAPCVLIPFPSAADNHQYFNAKQFADSGAALMIDQDKISGPEFERFIGGLLLQNDELAELGMNLEKWFVPGAAAEIADVVCAVPDVCEKVSAMHMADPSKTTAESNPMLRAPETLLV